MLCHWAISPSQNDPDENEVSFTSILYLFSLSAILTVLRFCERLCQDWTNERFFLHFCVGPSLNFKHLLLAPLEPLTTCYLPRTALSVAQVFLLPRKFCHLPRIFFELLPGDTPVLFTCPCPALYPFCSCRSFSTWYSYIPHGLCFLFLGSMFWEENSWGVLG